MFIWEYSWSEWEKSIPLYYNAVCIYLQFIKKEKNCTSYDVIYGEGKGYYKIFLETFLTEVLYQSHARIYMKKNGSFLTISLLNVNDGRKFIKSFKILCFDVFI